MPKPEPRTFRIASVRRATASTRIVRVDLENATFEYTAGQAASLRVEGQSGNVPYSISSAPAETARDGCLEFLTKVKPSGRWGHRASQLGLSGRVTIGGPPGTFA